MNKPISIAIRETKKDLLEVVNRSMLPPDVLQMIVTELAQVIEIKAQERYMQDLEEYNKASVKSEDREEKDNGV